MPHSLIQPSPVRNRLLAALPAESLARIQPKLHLVPAAQRQTLYAAEAAIDAVYFPEDCWVSLVAVLAEGGQAEVGVIGSEGMVGMPLVFGIETSFTEALVQGGGTALKMSAGAFRQELDENPPLRDRLFRYNEALQSQISQTAACNGRHGLEQRLARWLLIAHDRTDGDDLLLTQDFLAIMLGVHRPSVTVTARLLQAAGLIHYSNGTITIVDREGLEATSCECYEAVRRQFERLLGPAPE